eukprot:gnl/TRDRNA2_/TRDRNA2_155888_c0_seq1.p1 gnl/TRDRNA2_/TRDRNA2_155888_c0~~gnl/TRDRNA2_/TRDRNA2_155888_c0_seq1.p1  ORF type:complete len:238 (+),score=39.33 gnl/TRDRNA2_/TRDRNA2_155888_c0_seq1:68-781(+)
MPGLSEPLLYHLEVRCGKLHILVRLFALLIASCCAVLLKQRHGLDSKLLRGEPAVTMASWLPVGELARVRPVLTVRSAPAVAPARSVKESGGTSLAPTNRAYGADRQLDDKEQRELVDPLRLARRHAFATLVTAALVGSPIAEAFVPVGRDTPILSQAGVAAEARWVLSNREGRPLTEIEDRAIAAPITQSEFESVGFSTARLRDAMIARAEKAQREHDKAAAASSAVAVKVAADRS